MEQFKPRGYNSVAPYLVVPGAQKMIDFLKEVFDAKELRRYDNEDGSIMHAEVMIDDSVIMLGDASPQYPQYQLIMHVYVSDVDQVFARAVGAGAESVEKPMEKEGDPDRRGMFKDFAGNTWAVGTKR